MSSVKRALSLNYISLDILRAALTREFLMSLAVSESDGVCEGSDPGSSPSCPLVASFKVLSRFNGFFRSVPHNLAYATLLLSLLR